MTARDGLASHFGPVPAAKFKLPAFGRQIEDCCPGTHSGHNGSELPHGSGTLVENICNRFRAPCSKRQIALLLDFLRHPHSWLAPHGLHESKIKSAGPKAAGSARNEGSPTPVMAVAAPRPDRAVRSLPSRTSVARASSF